MSETFALRLEIDSEDLSTILETGEQLVVTKGPTSSTSQVVWSTFSPSEMNMVSWVDQYSLYVRWEQEIDPVGIVREVETDYPTASGTAYVLTGKARLRLGKQEFFPPTGTYRIFNQYDRADTEFGMFGVKQAIGSSRNRIVAQHIPFQQLADFTPENKVFVWLQSNVAVGDTVTIPPAVGAQPDGVTATAVKSRSTLIEYPPGVFELSCRYDAWAGGFVPA